MGIENSGTGSRKKVERNFEGIVEVYDETFYLNTETGVGVGAVLKKIGPLINKWAYKSRLPNYTIEDLKQEIAIIAIDGMKAFQPSRKVKLSTFLHTHINYKMISKIRNVNKIGNDASFLLEKDKDIERDKNHKKHSMRVARKECLFGSMNSNHKSKGKRPSNTSKTFDYQSVVKNEDGLYGSSQKTERYLNMRLSFDLLSKTLDEKTAKIIELILDKDYTIKAAAEEVGLTGWAASKRLKSLTRNKAFMTDFGDDLFVNAGEDK